MSDPMSQLLKRPSSKIIFGQQLDNSRSSNGSKRNPGQLFGASSPQRQKSWKNDGTYSQSLVDNGAGVAALSTSLVKYTKAPDAPKRFKPAFIFFSAEKHKEIRAQLGVNSPTERTSNISKLVSEAWKNLSPEERSKWDDLARDDKARYNIEKSTYTGPWRVPKQRKSKDANAPKRPMSAFLAFANSRRAELKRQMPEASNGELSRTLSIMWKEAPEELRQSYIKEEKEKRETYLVAIADWKRKAEEEKQSVRHVRQHEAQRTGESNLSSSYGDGAQDLTIPAFEHDNIEGNRYNRIGGSSSSLKMSSISHSRLSPYMLNNVSETYLQLGTEHQQPIPSLYESNHVAGIGWQGFQNHSSGASQYHQPINARQISACSRSPTRACENESIVDLPPNQQHRSHDAPHEYVSKHATRDTWNLGHLTQTYLVDPTLSPRALGRQAPQKHFNSSTSHVPRMALSTQDVFSQVYDIPFARASLARSHDGQQSHFDRNSTLMAGHDGIILSQSQLTSSATAQQYGSLNIVASNSALKTDRVGPHLQLSVAHGHGQYSNGYLAQDPTLNYMSANDGNEYFGQTTTLAQLRLQLDVHGRQHQTAFWKGDSGF